MITIDQVVAAAPPDVRETLDDDTISYLGTVIEGKTDPDDVRRALAPFLGMGPADLDRMFAKLSLSSAPTASAAPDPSSLLAEVETRPSTPSKKDKKKRTPAAPTGPSIMAYSQQSRFHSATLSTLSTEIDLRGVNVTVDEAELLVDARLWLKSGTHYGLVGRNGTGKSTLLSVIGDHSLIGFPENIRTLYVQQLDVVESDESVLSAVLSSDEEVTKRVRDTERIEAAVASADDGKIVDAITTYIERIANERILAAQKIATLRSGARGKKARGVALKAEQTMLASVREEVYGTSAESEAQVAARVLATLYDELSKMDADSAEARARAILAGLDIDEETADGPVSALSGGWRMRVALAKAMFVRPDLLLLDECTNHLDLAAIAWLQEYLSTLDVTIVCVSHDRDFLNGVSQEIIRLSDKTLSYHPGNYDEYEQNEEELAKKKQRQHEALQRRREHVQKSIERFMKHARSSNDDKVLGQVASRQKKLERMTGMEKTEDGKRFKVSYWAGYHDTMRPEIELKKAEASVDLKIPTPETLRGSGPLISLSSVSFSYPGRKRRVIKSVSLSIMPGDHIALLGLNGCGKSTLVQLLSGALAPTHGNITRHPGLRIGHYTQHFVDELSSVKYSALDILRTKAEKEVAEAIAKGREATAPKEGDLRKWLGGFEVSGQLAIRPVNTMSGGQRARLAMALMLWERPHILLLDEITNHLDMYAVQGLVAALNDYEGTVVLVTHDRHFVRETADDVYVLEEGRLRLLEEGIDEYVAQFTE
ncbi:hypothetical protein A1Q2_05931 [Trichosporon asahii var. asahii CBS 8904]|uniref:ABC transporter domain-containing protein n=1 Tax=Trichosporon asahii var. asahii (strain CBS 8904) TaxID=1220162 RepID=K1VG56_TRIAC|nr:hypothetical protein A1Q2_05931 [Trichosporon asahii var. asahii CBS 8904]